MRRWVDTFLRLAPIVTATCAVAVLGLVAFRAIAPLDDLRASSGELGTHLQTLGGIYAVLLAFIVFVVWNQFNEVRGLIEREASALVDLHRTASGLPAATRIEIQDGLLDYVDAVLRDEWHAMAVGDEAVIERVGRRLEGVWMAVHRCKPVDDCQHTIYGEVLSHFNELADLRTSRLSAARARVPRSMKVLLYLGAMIVTGSTYMMNIPVLWVHAFVTAALSGAIAHILYLIADLDDAFDGESQISKDAFVRARESFARVTHLVGVNAGPSASSSSPSQASSPSQPSQAS